LLLDPQKFRDTYLTAKGEKRAYVDLNELKTLWFLTGSRCNLQCEHCYIESSPKNDRLDYITVEDVKRHLDEIQELGWETKHLGFTGGEPFLNPQMVDILEHALWRGFHCLVLSNAYRMINRHKDRLLLLNEKYHNQLCLRISLDHYTEEYHEKERGPGTFKKALENIKWLHDMGFQVGIAGRSLNDKDQETAHARYQELLQAEGISLPWDNPDLFVVFPEMDTNKDVPEITEACWGILNKSPDDVMCASQRMIVKHKGQDTTTVMPCTLIAYDKAFAQGKSLRDAKQPVYLNHPFCAQFCVLGGASCSS
jgi:sulfatase maturation enzyme AslB (radical SAM superfamily)